MSRLESLVHQFTERTVREKERRIVLHMLPGECSNINPKGITQGFIKEVRRGNEPYCDVRIRREGMNRFTMTAKYRPRKQESTTTITRDIFDTLWPKVTARQYKERYNLGNGWIVDNIKTPRPMIVAEFEYKEGREHCVVPKSFRIKEDLGVK